LRRRRPGRENRQALISAEADLTGIALPALATFTVGGLSTGPKNPENENGSRPAIAKAENEVAIPQIRWLTRSGDPGDVASSHDPPTKWRRRRVDSGTLKTAGS